MMYPSDRHYPSGDSGHHKIDLSSDNVSLTLILFFGDMMDLVPENGDRILSPKNKFDDSRGSMGSPRRYDVSQRSAQSIR